MNVQDVLKEISNEDLKKLRDIYKKHFPRALYIYNFLSSAIKWKMRYPHENYVMVMAPNGKWQEGTFIALQQFHCYEIYMFTLASNCEDLYAAIVNTKMVDWSRRILIYAIHIDHYPIVLKALNKTDFALREEIPCSIWWMPMEKALSFEITCPSEVYIAKLKKSDALTINTHWPHKYPGSEKYLAFVIDTNGGYGIYRKSSSALIAWILRIQIGMGTLQVMEGHKRKGYGSLVAKVLAKEMAQEGFHPVASILNNNNISQAMFKKLGFELCAPVVYLDSNGF